MITVAIMAMVLLGVLIAIAPQLGIVLLIAAPIAYIHLKIVEKRQRYARLAARAEAGHQDFVSGGKGLMNLE